MLPSVDLGLYKRMLQRLFWREALLVVESKTMMQQIDQVFNHLCFVRILNLVRHAELQKVFFWLLIDVNHFDGLSLCDLVLDDSEELEIIGEIDRPSQLSTL